MSSRENSRPASFKKIPFFVDSISTQEGAKRVKYLYLGTDRRTQKKIAEFPPVFSVKGHTYGATGDSYEKARDQLRRVLKEESAGIFVDPFGGNNNCTSDVYTFVQDFKESNRCNFTITFSTITDEKANPQKIKTGNASSVATQAIETSRVLQREVAKALVVDTPELLDQSKSFFDGTSDLMKGFKKLGQKLSSGVEFAEKALKIKDKVDFYAANPLIGLAAITDNLLGVSGLTTDIFAIFETFKSIFQNFDPFPWLPDNSNISVPSDPASAQAKSNFDSQQNFIRSSLMIEGISQAALIDYSSAEQIENVKKEINNQFVSLSLSMSRKEPYQYQFPQVSTPSYYDVVKEMKRLKTDVFELLDENKKNVRQVVEVELAYMPASVWAYTLYGDSSRAIEMMELNTLVDFMNVGGNLRAYSE